jgi:hypothetical protein
MAMGDVGFAESIAFFRLTVISNKESLFAIRCGASERSDFL